MNKKILSETINILLTIAASIISALALHYFVYSAAFAPAGLDGVATMLYQLTGINAGIFILAFNLPLLIVALFILKRRFVIYTVVYSVVSSGALLILELIGFPYYSGGDSGLIAAVFSGVLLGVRTGIMLKIGASTGGVDIIASMIQVKKPYLNTERIITILCYGIIFSSYFLYRDITCILLSVIQMFIFDKFAGYMLKSSRSAIEVTIVTREPDTIKNELIYKLKHGATILSSKGMYTDGESSVIISLINIRQIPDFLEIMKNHPETFTYYGELMGVKGNFRWKNSDEVK